MRSFIMIRPTVWPQYTNVTDRQTGQTDRQDRQRYDSIGRTVLQTVAQKCVGGRVFAPAPAGDSRYSPSPHSRLGGGHLSDIPTLGQNLSSPSKLPLSIGGSGLPSNSWFPGPTRANNPNGILIGSAVFAGLTSVTDRQTDRPRYSVGNNRPHLRP